jgi:hypothetical protein
MEFSLKFLIYGSDFLLIIFHHLLNKTVVNYRFKNYAIGLTNILYNWCLIVRKGL